MKRSTKLALTIALAAGSVVPALAQDNFPDVPANHWAYDAVAKLKADGILVGYPDGLFRGPRPASRYELAVALHAAYSHLKSLIDGLTDQVKALQNVNPQDIQNLKDQIAHLQDEINAMKGWGDDIAALKKATEEFDRELRSLGVDVEAMKKDLGDLQERVSRLEKRKPAVDISGDMNFFAVTTNSS
ncbi:MAG TPA: S-layer homology domain-containing protein, partial [Fimbriimonas sp.]|nr:S-layer homology domain-containing protein [Fimbriimonas sp.]